MGSDRTLLRSKFLPNGSSCAATCFADLDCNGKADLVHCGRTANRIRVYWNRHDSLSTGDYSDYPMDMAENIYVADIDKDGYLDIIAGSQNINYLRIYWGNETYTGMSHNDFPTPDFCLSFNIECADLDNDGDLDIIVPSCSHTQDFFIFENLGSRSSFTRHTLTTSRLDGYQHG
jgi:hypothetical protein